MAEHSMQSAPPKTIQAKIRPERPQSDCRREI